MLRFSVGNKWDERFLYSIARLNERYGNSGAEVVELYGSLPYSETGLRSARPDFRLPQVSLAFMKKYISLVHSVGLKINYTINAPFCEPIGVVHENMMKVKDTVKRLEDIGVDVFTVADTLLIEVMGELTDRPLEISSVLHARSVAQIPIYKKWGVNQICMDVVSNRDISFLQAFRNAAKTHGLDIKLIVNEFCTIGGAPCSGLYQADCVIHSALGGNEKNLFDGWPFSRCACSRKENPSAWLKSHFILPQWLSEYVKSTGITLYKITGRTLETDWLIGVIEAYLRQEYNDDIRNLWIDPGSLSRHKMRDESDFKSLKGETIYKKGFIDYWFNNPSFRCHEHCGFDCDYCEKFFVDNNR